MACCISFDSYIKPQRVAQANLQTVGCISFDSYIKPQPIRLERERILVVYLLIPTSNHNAQKGFIESQTLYIF